MHNIAAVSYTHLDVYKRQTQYAVITTYSGGTENVTEPFTAFAEHVLTTGSWTPGTTV